ncbi:DUF2808 domain-containing protein [Gloeothece verrucosa]|uniref:DUF2808 domain-containing protein n=1 Tax=Gloeothece verrucosa (strain PCC 7822) TaxID=497965 RepID=E0ULE5_GLOV7|nr:DUF2808 domain-containing protein [Gloeothece verrucosa]ADN17775.1 conserved hypothetical protein [Gloeothece verrucosa PCC 7822]
MRFLNLLTLTLSISSLTLATPTPAQQLPYPANSTFFTGTPPSLVSANTPDPLIAWPHPHYYFTFNLPASSPESLAKITIAPEANQETIGFDLLKTVASQSTANTKEATVALESITQDPKSGLITMTFNPPISPGTTLTVTLQAYRNPGIPGTYLFRVQAFPAGENPVGLDLGVGSLSFHQLL